MNANNELLSICDGVGAFLLYDCYVGDPCGSNALRCEDRFFVSELLDWFGDPEFCRGWGSA